MRSTWSSLLYTSRIVPLCFEQFQRLAPLQQWLVDVLK